MLPEEGRIECTAAVARSAGRKRRRQVLYPQDLTQVAVTQ